MERARKLVRGGTLTAVLVTLIAACRSAAEPGEGATTSATSTTTARSEATPDRTSDRTPDAPESPAVASEASHAEAVPTPSVGGVGAPTANASTTASTTATVDPATRTLFLAQCAACHGERGDGQGTTKLERAARSFLAGGFSYGNTPESVVRSITHGIPGTPMPSFAQALSHEQRASLAAYVIALGPPQIEVEGRESVLVVRDEAVVARGKLPALVEGGPEIVRGLLVGLPGGLSFAYDTDDARLVAVRTGEFADRRDWIGRGGDVLRPLGVDLALARAPADRGWSCEDGSRATTWRGSLAATRVRGATVTISWALASDASGPRLDVDETLVPLAGGGPSGWVRAWSVTCVDGDAARVVVPLGPGDVLSRALVVGGTTVFYRVEERADGGVDLVGARADLERSGLALHVEAREGEAGVAMMLAGDLPRGATIVFETFCIPSASSGGVGDVGDGKTRLAGYAWP